MKPKEQYPLSDQICACCVILGSLGIILCSAILWGPAGAALGISVVAVSFGWAGL